MKLKYDRERLGELLGVNDSGELTRGGEPVRQRTIWVDGARLYAPRIVAMLSGGRVNGENRASQPIVRALIDMVAMSGMSDEEIEKKSGLGESVISQWRRGQHGANIFSASLVGEVLGYELVWRKKQCTGT